MITSGTKAKIALVALLTLTAAACGDDGGTSSTGSSEGTGAAESQSYKVGVILPLTGPAAAIGTDFNTGLEVFRDIDPDAEGLEIEYVVCDDKSTPDGAAACARQVIQQDQVNMIYGPVISGTHSGARPVLLTGPPSITPSPYATAQGGEPIFSAAGNALDLDTTTLKFAVDRGYKRVAVLATTDTTGETAVKNVETANKEFGLDIAVERMGPTDVDASAQLNRLLESDPEYIYVATSGAAAGVALKGLKQLGADLPTALIWSNTTNGFLKAAEPVFPSETLYAIAPAWLPETLDDEDRAQQVTEFQEAFEERAGAPVSFVVQGAYDAFQLIAVALKEAGGEKDALMEYLQGLEDFQGLNWKLSYSEDNHIGAAEDNYTMMTYSGGTWSEAKKG
jgi:branched-chain amino acid transport system substrate-binding protein